MQRDRRLVERVGEDVILERRDEAAGGSDGRVHAALFLEPVGGGPGVRFSFFLNQVVLRDVHPSFDDPFDAPDAGVIVERRRLARSPRHDDRRVAEVVVAVQQPAGVALGPHATEPIGQRNRPGADGILQLPLHLQRDRLGIRHLDGFVDPGDELGHAVGHRDPV